MTRILVSLVTLGDPDTPTGGYLYHRRLADLAPRHDAALRFASFPTLPFPLPRVARRRVVRAAAGADVVVLDSIAAAFWGRARPAPTVVMAHQPPGGIDHGPLRSRLQARLDRDAYRAAKLVMVASRSLVAAMRAAGVPEDRLVVVEPGRDVAAAPAIPPGDLRLGRKAAILCVGNWVARKGIVELLDAFAALPADAATLHLVGSQDIEPAYAARVRERLGSPELAGRVKVHGVISKEEVVGLYRDADLFALASEREPYGTVYGEAMAMGLPVVGWAAGNLPHLADDGKEGLIVPLGDVGALTRALERLVTDEELRRRLAVGALERAQRLPTWDETAERFFATVRRAAGR